MDKTIGWLRLAFLGAFLAATAATWIYQIYWVAPRQQCESTGRWWNNQHRECGIPVSVSRFTGRPTPAEAAAAAAKASPTP